jgi:predicted RNA-binding Zn-ribbon protein involved in translation (DUF1610 family)
MSKRTKKERHSSTCDNCGERLDNPYLSDVLDWIKYADLPLDKNEGDVRIKCPNCSEGWMWLRLQVEAIEDE